MLILHAQRYDFLLTNECANPRCRNESSHCRNSRWLEHSLMRSSFSLRSFDTISMRGRSIRVLPCKMKIAFSGITGDVRRMKMPLPCCDHDNMVEGNWSLCLRSSTPPPWFHASNSRFVLGQISPREDTNLALFSRVEARWSTKWKEFAYINMNELSLFLQQISSFVGCSV